MADESRESPAPGDLDYAKLRGTALRFLLSRLRSPDRDDAEDLAQIALTRLWGYVLRKGPPRIPEAMTVCIAKRVLISYFEVARDRRKRFLQWLESDADKAPAPDEIEAYVVADEAMRVHFEAISFFDREERESLCSRILGALVADLSFEFMAEMWNKPAPALRQRWHRCREILAVAQGTGEVQLDRPIRRKR